ncbi:hypothetical protein QRX25_08735 [Bacillus sp. L381]|jgi:hypothetical protein|uniref:Uncharacterized protein n=1 Tax=Bacillus amyloliquefaciens (strain ATCC 23350 / DSM 7 / BCRC 11601 / CCUG 28519 / NBRC 15535 / NRRL B-14393 / F) TaxID=692420 RepID=A0A9P1JH55_BACAS|nr:MULTISPECIES: hypothetical protein [Bacillus]AEB23809.1 hypothetical protein BAMTA208_08180 [Bacillus amyloliquefaciens TA208]AEB63492.1 hypothetical protein LL3_01953 [Bacillus amyloliquefaciens LL3]AEK88805.1 hypothetical protein BAXH7_01669 [Bacillus amyloliquefaciens XH7]AOC91222.1 hypothetical protein BARD7_01752 [Bacillus amyloliquefaciens]ARW39123.1 hypothetical protein S101267_02035 [Bacillus amyloliquefaciens]
MKVMIGSIILLVIIGFGLWLMLSPIFKQVGSKAKKFKKSWEEEDQHERK